MTTIEPKTETREEENWDESDGHDTHVLLENGLETSRSLKSSTCMLPPSPPPPPLTTSLDAYDEHHDDIVHQRRRVKAELAKAREENKRLLARGRALQGLNNTTASVSAISSIFYTCVIPSSHAGPSPDEEMAAAWRTIPWSGAPPDNRWTNAWYSISSSLPNMLKFAGDFRIRLKEHIIAWNRCATQQDRLDMEARLKNAIEHRTQVRHEIIRRRPEILMMFYENAMVPSRILARERRRAQSQICRSIHLCPQRRAALRAAYVTYKTGIDRLDAELDVWKRSTTTMATQAKDVGVDINVDGARKEGEEQQAQAQALWQEVATTSATANAQRFLLLSATCGVMKAYTHRVMVLYEELMCAIDPILGWRAMITFNIGLHPMAADFSEVCAELI